MFFLIIIGLGFGFITASTIKVSPLHLKTIFVFQAFNHCIKNLFLNFTLAIIHFLVTV